MKVKTFTLVRHGKAGEAETDIERQLTNDGREGVQRVALDLVKNRCVPEMILCSSAERAKETSEILRSAFLNSGFQCELISDNELYLCRTNYIYKRISESDPGATRIMIVGHNPAIAEMVMNLSGGAVYKVQPGLAVTFKTVDWRLVQEGAECELVNVASPHPDGL